MILFLISALSAVSRYTFAQTTIAIVGTVHNPTHEFGKSDLYRILQNFRPDLILFEFDSALMGPEMKFRKQFLNIFEVNVIDSFITNNPGVLVRPFDIEGRNGFFAKTNYFSEEVNMFTEISRLYNTNLLSPDYMALNKKALALNEAVNNYASQSASRINSKAADDAVEAKMNWYHQNFPGMIRNTPSLQQYQNHMRHDSTFWQTRNLAMARHIEQFALLYKNKRILVITGHYHRYILKKLLSARNGNLRLKEFYDPE
jgi:hypothetical protein